MRMFPAFSRICFLLVCMLNIIFSSKGMLYNEELKMEDFDNLFNNEDCIDGTLSVSEFGSATIKSMSFETSPSLLKTETNQMDNLGGKSPLTYINDLAVIHKIKHQYTLIGEEGPDHKKKFIISLQFGNEHYEAEGSSIKKAQHEAAKFAINSTAYKHPPTNPKSFKPPKLSKSPVDKLSEWAKNHGDLTVTYTFNQQAEFRSALHKNYYHKSIYSKAENIHKVALKVADREYIGEGSSSDLAKQNAASNALKQLQNEEGFCTLDDKERNLLSKVFASNSDSSPITTVFEFGSKSKLPVSFDLVSEEGPAHIKKFVFKCAVDSFETFGEGSSKKEAKSEAAKSMVDKLKTHAIYSGVNCIDNPKKKQKKRKSSKNLVKSVVKNVHTEDEYSELHFPSEIDPISKLMQIHQAKHDVKPIFKLIEEKGQANKEFFIEVCVGELTHIGSGPNKKTAKKKAAEGMLQKLGYSSVIGENRKYVPDLKKTEFVDSKAIYKKPLAPGINLNSDQFVKLEDHDKSKSEVVNKRPDKLKDSKYRSKDSTTDSTSESKSHKVNEIKPVKQLKDLSLQLGFRFQFSDFPSSGGKKFISLVSVTTDPPKICYGIGSSVELSQDNAALKALGIIYKVQLNSISKILQKETTDSLSKQLYVVDEKTLLQTSVTIEKE